MSDTNGSHLIAAISAIAAIGSCIGAFLAAHISRKQKELAEEIARRAWENEHKEAYPSPIFLSAKKVAAEAEIDSADTQTDCLVLELGCPVDRPIHVYGANISGQIVGFQSFQPSIGIAGLETANVRIPIQASNDDIGASIIRVYYLSGDSYGKRTFRDIDIRQSEL